MFPFSPVFMIFFSLIWIALGLALGGLTGIIMTGLLRQSKSKVIADLVFGVVGCLLGVFISGWASRHTFNAGVRREYFIWDENGQAVDWRTALAEHQWLIAILGAIVLVVLWRFAVVAYRKRNGSNFR
jgi:uncharacterized membrane protein YeaQ/YmgE (transglycosylase-associated protein family)